MILVIVGHSDDESFWMGGTLALLSERDKVAVVALSDGVGSRFEPGITDRMGYDRDQYEKAKRSRHKAFLRACGVLGAECVQLELFEDQRATSADQLEINKSVAVLIDDYQPTTVYTHHPGDQNGDHRVTAEAVYVAARGASWELYTMRPEWPHLCVGQPWVPTSRHAFGGRVIEAKVKACECYQDEVRDYPHPRSLKAVREGWESFTRIQ